MRGEELKVCELRAQDAGLHQVHTGQVGHVPHTPEKQGQDLQQAAAEAITSSHLAPPGEMSCEDGSLGIFLILMFVALIFNKSVYSDQRLNTAAKVWT